MFTIFFSFNAVRVCPPCVTGSGCCAKVLGVCITPCLKFGTCCTSIEDPVCVTANAGCELLIAAAKETLSLAQGVLDGAKTSLNAAKAVLAVAEGAVTAAQGVLDGANAVLEGVKIAVEAGTKAASFIADFALTDILSITEMYFNVELSKANGGVFECRVKGVLVGQNIDAQFSFNTNDLAGIAKSLANEAADGIGNFIG